MTSHSLPRCVIVLALMVIGFLALAIKLIASGCLWWSMVPFVAAAGLGGLGMFLFALWVVQDPRPEE